MLLNKRHVIATWRLALKYPHSPDIFFKRHLTSKPPITFTFYPCVFLFCVSCASFLLVLRSLYSFSSFLCFFFSLFSVFFWFQARLQLFLYPHRVLSTIKRITARQLSTDNSSSSSLPKRYKFEKRSITLSVKSITHNYPDTLYIPFTHGI